MKLSDAISGIICLLFLPVGLVCGLVFVGLLLIAHDDPHAGKKPS